MRSGLKINADGVLSQGKATQHVDEAFLCDAGAKYQRGNAQTTSFQV